MMSVLDRAPRWCLVLALLLLNALLLTPELPWAGFPPRHWIALEAPLVVGLLALLPPAPWRRWVVVSWKDAFVSVMALLA